MLHVHKTYVYVFCFADMMVAIRWVKQSLKYYLEDIIDDPDSDESVPLVPIDAECILAIGNSDFKLFLKQLGIQPPGVQVGRLKNIGTVN